LPRGSYWSTEAHCCRMFRAVESRVDGRWPSRTRCASSPCRPDWPPPQKGSCGTGRKSSVPPSPAFVPGLRALSRTTYTRVDAAELEPAPGPHPAGPHPAASPFDKALDRHSAFAHLGCIRLSFRQAQTLSGRSRWSALGPGGGELLAARRCAWRRQRAAFEDRRGRKPGQPYATVIADAWRWLSTRTHTRANASSKNFTLRLGSGSRRTGQQAPAAIWLGLSLSCGGRTYELRSQPPVFRHRRIDRVTPGGAPPDLAYRRCY
jgi:hypothetical protein